MIFAFVTDWAMAEAGTPFAGVLFAGLEWPTRHTRPGNLQPQADVDPYMLVDGHLRHTALAEIGATTAPCLVAGDDEGFTYNKRVNRLATVQEHYMIVKALERGVSEERLARALNIDIRQIKLKRSLLAGICPEVTDMLKDRSVDASVFAALTN